MGDLGNGWMSGVGGIFLGLVGWAGPGQEVIAAHAADAIGRSCRRRRGGPLVPEGGRTGLGMSARDTVESEDKALPSYAA